MKDKIRKKDLCPYIEECKENINEQHFKMRCIGIFGRRFNYKECDYYHHKYTPQRKASDWFKMARRLLEVE